MGYFEFKTISETALLSEAQDSILARMVGVLEDMQEHPWDKTRYDKYKLWSSRYDELHERIIEIAKEVAAEIGEE